MKKTVVRWTIGETEARSLSEQALDMLDLSIKFCQLKFDRIFERVKFFVCHNNLSKETLNRVKKITKNNEVNLMDVNDELPKRLKNNKVKNSWWKFAPPRVSPDSYEIIMDNDVLLWDVPDTLMEAHKEESILALTDGKGDYYGDYTRRVKSIDPDLKLNAGLLGLPPEFSFDLGSVDANSLNDFFHSEQGFTALQFLSYQGPKTLISLKEVPQLNVDKIKPTRLISEYKGGHFCGCSYDHFDYWEKLYHKPLTEHYNKIKVS